MGYNVAEKLLKKHLPIDLLYKKNSGFFEIGKNGLNASCPVKFLQQFLDNKMGCLLMYEDTSTPTQWRMKLVSREDANMVLNKKDQNLGFSDQEYDSFKKYLAKNKPDALSALFDKSTPKWEIEVYWSIGS